MPNPMLDPDGGDPIWFFRLACGCAITARSHDAHAADDEVRCAGHGPSTVERLETGDEVDERCTPA